MDTLRKYKNDIRKMFFVSVDYKVYRYVKILKRYFKKIETDKKNSNLIYSLKKGLENIQKEYIKEVRKEKLDQLNK